MKLKDLPAAERVAMARAFVQQNLKCSDTVLVDAIMQTYGLSESAARDAVATHEDHCGK